MNEQVRQRKSLKAKLELLEQDFRKGRCTEEDLFIAQRAYDNFKKSTQRDEQKEHGTNIRAGNGKIAVAEADGKRAPRIPEKTETIDFIANEVLSEIQGKLQEIDQEKARLSNSLKTVPKNQNAEEITSRILQLREDWRRVKDTESYYLQHGCLPAEDVPEIPEGWTDKLPRNKFELNKRIKNLKNNLESPSKWQASLTKARTPGKKHEMERKINQGLLELAAMETLFKSL
jgi:hypothetical protein